jgi:hypothetical protein
LKLGVYIGKEVLVCIPLVTGHSSRVFRLVAIEDAGLWLRGETTPHQIDEDWRQKVARDDEFEAGSGAGDVVVTAFYPFSHIAFVIPPLQQTAPAAPVTDRATAVRKPESLKAKQRSTSKDKPK